MDMARTLPPSVVVHGRHHPYQKMLMKRMMMSAGVWTCVCGGCGRDGVMHSCGCVAHRLSLSYHHRYPRHRLRVEICLDVGVECFAEINFGVLVNLND